MTPATLHALAAAARLRRVAVVLTRLSDGLQHLVVESGDGLFADIEPPLLDAARDAAKAGRSVSASIAGKPWFIHVHGPAPRLVLVGAVHVAQALAPLARTLGMMVSVIDPRSGFATTARFPDVALLELWPDEALLRLSPDTHTAIVTLSHEARLDDPALDCALRGPAFYVGALGSRRTQAARRARLSALGHDATTLARLRGPVGLPIGAIGPQEIALSIMAEIVAVRRRAALSGAAPLGTAPLDTAPPDTAPQDTAPQDTAQ